jgi:putative NADH-flavin reductase
MRLFVLGATGGIGRQLVQQGLSRHHQVTAFVRSPQKMAVGPENLRVISGDVRNEEQLRNALPGHDAILSSLGHRRGGPATLLSASARSVIAAMKDTDLRRILVVSVAFLFPESGLPGAILRNIVLRANGADSKGMERIVAEGGLDWTVVRPPRLTNGPRTERYRVEDSHLPPRGSVISRADVAHFMLDEAERGAHIRQIVGVAR